MFDEDSDSWPPIERPTSESQRVESWRLHILVEAGYPVTLAEDLAASPIADLHQAVALVKGGCPHELAAAILL